MLSMSAVNGKKYLYIPTCNKISITTDSLLSRWLLTSNSGIEGSAINQET